MINHRHTRGVVLDLNSEVCPRSFLDSSQIGEAADVYRTTAIDTWIDTSKVVHSRVVGCDIRGSEVLQSTAAWSDIVDSKVYDAELVDSKIQGATIRGGTLLGCEINADCVVGDAVLEGLNITTPMRIGYGHWRRVPRSFEINNSVASGVVITESTDGHAYIGCQRKPMKTWIKGADRFGRVIGWDKETVAYITGKFKEWLEDNGNV